MKTRKRLALASIAFLVAGAVGFSDAAVASPQRDTTASMIAHDAPGTPDRELRSTWRPYDNSAITTPDGCERRRTWLINNVGWVTRTRSKCSAFTVPVCPRPKTIYKVMVLVDSRALLAPSRDVDQGPRGTQPARDPELRC